MAIIRDDSQQTTASLSVTTDSGERRQAVIVNCHIRPGKGLSVNVDVLETDAVTDANRAELAAAVASYLGDELRKAAALGVPVGIPAATP